MIILAIVDSVQGIQVFSYEGRIISSIKFSGMKPDWISHHNLTLTTDILFVRDNNDEKGRP